jgi:2-polyprenyl-3-methyl-5-hydroxy-6-metoxy-1,4-benzoquinol methylase
MRQPVPSDDWSELWKGYFQTDRAEWWGWRINIGYTYAYQRRFAEAMRLVGRYLPTGSTIIDVAGGQGNFSLALAEHGYRMVWNDLQADLQGYVQLKWEAGDIRYLPGNAFEIDHEHLYDAVLATEIIEHVAHPDDFLAQLASLVRPGGLIFLSTPHGGYVRTGLPTFAQVHDHVALESQQFQPGSEGHLFLFTNDELIALAAAAGLDVVEMTNFTSPVFSSARGLAARSLRFVPRRVADAINGAVERMSKRLLMNTAVVLRRPSEV